MSSEGVHVNGCGGCFIVVLLASVVFVGGCIFGEYRGYSQGVREYRTPVTAEKGR